MRRGEPPRPSRGRPRKDGSPAQARTTTTTGRQEATRDDPMPGSSDDHLRQPTTETDVIDQSIVMDSGTARVGDDGGDQGVLRMDQEEGISAEEQAQRRLRSKQPARRSLTDDETVSKRLKREATIAAIKQEMLKTAAERPDLEQAHKFCASMRTLRSPESIHASRMVEIRKAAMAAGGQMFNARRVDEQHKEKSRYVVKDFANTRDPTMLAAAGDTAVGRVVQFKAEIQNYSMFTFDVTSAYTHAWEDELVFPEPPPEEIEEHGDCVWRSITVIYGRRKGARSRQEHFDSILRGEEARQRGFTVESHPKCPTLCFVREADGVIELHVDDGHGCGKETIVAELLTSLSEMRDSDDRREQLVKRLDVYTDSDWASDQVTRKSRIGAVIMAEGMRLHAHSRGQATVALSSCEAEVMAASEGIKEALLLQEVLMFVGLGHYEIEIKVDSSAAHAFFH